MWHPFSSFGGTLFTSLFSEQMDGKTDGIVKWQINFGWKNLPSHYIEHARMEHYFKVIKRRNNKGILLKGNWDDIKRYQPWNEKFDPSI